MARLRVPRVLKRLLRRRVPAGALPARREGRGGDDGGASVREPRRPLPKGPRSDAEAAPIPPPDQAVKLSDPRG